MHRPRPDHPFQPHTTPDRDTLTAYLRGSLPPGDQHRVEAALEADPLLREAAEGLAGPGALDALATLDKAHPGPGLSIRPGLGGLVLLLVVAGAAIVLYRPSTDAPVADASTVQQDTIAAVVTGAAEMPTTLEIESSVEQPESLRIGHAAMDRHTYAARNEQRIERTPPPERIGTTTPPIAAKGPATRTPKRARGSWQLHYLHDLKLVHPSEIHPARVGGTVVVHTAARFRDRAEQGSAQEQERTMAYLPFMDEALARFARGDHKGSLEELRFLLGQYPDDVNALFYAGLCAYNLALYPHAERLLHRAAAHPVDVFAEEALWYHALTLERMGRTVEARATLRRIAAEGGFYSTPATERMR